jgi:hypothetical protein
MRLANTTMQYQASAIRAKPVCSGLRSHPPPTAPDASSFSSRLSSSLVQWFLGSHSPFLGPPRSHPQQFSHQLPERVYSTDTVGHRLVITLASHVFHIFGVRRWTPRTNSRELSQIPHPSPRLSASYHFLTASTTCCLVSGMAVLLAGSQ